MGHTTKRRVQTGNQEVRGYPETFQHRYTSTKQPPCDNEKQDDYMKRAGSS